MRITSAAEEVAREVAAEHGIDALALKAAYIAEAEGFWHRLSADDLKVKLGEHSRQHVADGARERRRRRGSGACAAQRASATTRIA